jgi:murein DD-endopeptidase MepM/ murein hydrolase activator NlpD
MRLGILIRVTAVALFGLSCYYLGWRRGTQTETVSRTAEQGVALVRFQSDQKSEPQSDGDYTVLLHRRLGLPIAGLKLPDIRDTFDEGRANGKPHEATDILAPRGTPVLAIQDGTIRKLFTSVPGGLTIYEFDPEEIYCYYYGHLDRYAEGLREGAQVSRGQVIGYVGTTGNAPVNTPHLHLAIFKLGPEKRWWQGVAINPYPVLRELAGG